MTPVFSEIVYIHGVEAMDGALQMAIDELLLTEVSGVLLRDYSWLNPTQSIGYFGFSSESLAKSDVNPTTDLIRRPTGGGHVEHGHGCDYTYSVVVSSQVARELQLAPRQSYRVIHGVLAMVLRSFGLPAALACDDVTGQGGQSCFANPVGDDLLMDGVKIAGAGQKRSRGAILHQGSVQPTDLPPEFGEAFASCLAEKIERSELDSALLAKAEALADRKYRQDAWNLRR